MNSVLKPTTKKVPSMVKLIKIVITHKKLVNLFLKKFFNPSAKRNAILSIIHSPLYPDLAL